MIHLYEEPAVVKFIEKNQNGETTDLEEEVLWSYCLMGTEFAWHEEKVLEMNCGNGCVTMQIYLMPPNYTLKNS